MNIKNYCLIVESTAETLVDEVTSAMKEGFQPIGGVSVAFEPATTDVPAGGEKKRVLCRPRSVYSQAMVRLVSARDVYGQIVT
jgi:Domain of unknown function (DUF1737)